MTLDILFGISGRIVLTIWSMHCPISVASRLLPPLPFFLPSIMSLVHSFIPNSTHCWRIHAAWWKLSNRSQPLNEIKKSATTSTKCKLVCKPQANLPDTPEALASTSKYFLILLGPPGGVNSALKLCTSILSCFWKWLQWWRCSQDATRFGYYHRQILEQVGPLGRAVEDFECSRDLCADLWDTSRGAETSAPALRKTWCHSLTEVALRVLQPQGIRFIMFIFHTVAWFAKS